MTTHQQASPFSLGDECSNQQHNVLLFGLRIGQTIIGTNICSELYQVQCKVLGVKGGNLWVLPLFEDDAEERAQMVTKSNGKMKHGLSKPLCLRHCFSTADLVRVHGFTLEDGTTIGKNGSGASAIPSPSPPQQQVTVPCRLSRHIMGLVFPHETSSSENCQSLFGVEMGGRMELRIAKNRGAQTCAARILAELLMGRSCYSSAPSDDDDNLLCVSLIVVGVRFGLLWVVPYKQDDELDGNYAVSIPHCYNAGDLQRIYGISLSFSSHQSSSDGLGYLSRLQHASSRASTASKDSYACSPSSSRCLQKENSTLHNGKEVSASTGTMKSTPDLPPALSSSSTLRKFLKAYAVHQLLTPLEKKQLRASFPQVSSSYPLSSSHQHNDNSKRTSSFSSLPKHPHVHVKSDAFHQYFTTDTVKRMSSAMTLFRDVSAAPDNSAKWMEQAEVDEIVGHLLIRDSSPVMRPT